MKSILIYSFLLCSIVLSAQNNPISGFVYDAIDKESLIGAHVYLEDRSIGVATDNRGYFSLTLKLPAKLCVSCIGYEDTCFTITKADKPISIELIPANQLLNSIDIVANRFEKKQINVLILNSKSIEQIPAIGSRPDIIKAAQQLPGIEAATEASSLMLVRGGNPGENLYLLDNVPLIYVNHLGGFMSVFNTEMINTMDIYKGGFPARFGGKLSSIVDLTSKKGDPSRLKGALSVGLTDLSFSVEGPGIQQRSSFIVSGRKTLTEPLLYGISLATKLAKAQDFSILYGFHDINAKYTWTPNDKHNLSFNIYESDDYLYIWKTTREHDFKEHNSISNIWGNLLISAQCNSVVNPRLFATNLVSFTRYRLKNKFKAYQTSSIDTTDFHIRAASMVNDLSLQSHWKYSINNYWALNYGVALSYLNYAPNHFTSSYSGSTIDLMNVFDNSLFMEAKLTGLTWLHGTTGIRCNYYHNAGYSHFALEPRLNLSITLNDNTFNLSATRITQNAHLLMTPGSILNNEIWIPADSHIIPSSSYQFTIGWQHEFADGHILLDINAYYKLLSNLSTYKEGCSMLIGDHDWRNKIETGGEGKSSGLESFAKFDYGSINGYVGYTFSHTSRVFPNINQGKPFVYEYDRPHSIKINLNYQLSEQWRFFGLWVFQSGLPFTPIIGIQINPTIEADGNIELIETNIYGERNSSRMKAYHRLDIGAKYCTKSRKGRKAEWSFSLYNAYCHQNPYYYYYGDKEGQPISWNQFPDDPKQLWQRSYFTVIPSFSYKILF